MSESNSTQDQTVGIREIVRILKSLPVDMLSLVTMETKLFGYTALAMLKVCVMIGLLLVAGWLFAGATAVIALEGLETFNLIGALLVVTLLNLVMAALLIWRLRHIARDLTFRESRASASTLLAHAQSLLDASEKGQEK